MAYIAGIHYTLQNSNTPPPPPPRKFELLCNVHSNILHGAITLTVGNSMHGPMYSVTHFSSKNTEIMLPNPAVIPPRTQWVTKQWPGFVVINVCSRLVAMI